MFKPRTRYLLFSLLCFFSLVLSACATSIDEETGDAEVGASVQALTAADVAKITVIVTGPGIGAPIVSDLAHANGQWKGTIGGIPSGVNRAFVATAYDAANTALYEGQVGGVTITAGSTAGVVLVLQQKTAPVPFENSAPRITGLVASSTLVDQGQPVTLTLSAVDPDGDSLIYAWSAPAGTFAGGDTDHPVWTSPTVDGDYPLGVSVKDGRGGQAGITLTIATYKGKGKAKVHVSFNTWPVVTEVSAMPGQLDAGTTSVLGVTAMDPDGDPLTFVWSDGACGGTFSDVSAESPVWTAPLAPPPGGDCALVVSPNDGKGGTTTGTLHVHVGLPDAPNAAPVIDQSSQSADWMSAGGAVELDVTAHDPEGQAISFAWSATAGALGAPVNGPTSSHMVWTAPPGCASSIVTVTVSDPLGAQTSETFVIGPGMVLHNRLEGTANGSPITVPSDVGPDGTMDGAGTFIPVMFDQGFSSRGGAVEFPGSVIDPEEGTVELWTRIIEQPVAFEYGVYGFVYTAYVWGSPVGIYWHNPDLLNATVTMTTAWAPQDVTLTSTWDPLPENGSLHHLALVWRRAGISDALGDHTARLYLDGALQASSTSGAWGVDNSSPLRVGAAQDQSWSTDHYAVDNLKVYPCAKTDFADRFTE